MCAGGARPVVERDDARLVDHLVAERDEARRLDDLVAVVVDDRHHRADDAARDAAVVRAELVGALESGLLHVGAAGVLLPRLAFRRHRRHLAVWRIDDQRRLPRRHAALEPVRRRRRHAADVAQRDDLGGRLLEIEVEHVDLSLAAAACFSRALNSSSVRNSRLPNCAGRSKGTPTMSVPGQIPCRSGSPHGVFGGVYGVPGCRRRLRRQRHDQRNTRRPQQPAHDLHSAHSGLRASIIAGHPTDHGLEAGHYVLMTHHVVMQRCCCTLVVLIGSARRPPRRSVHPSSIASSTMNRVEPSGSRTTRPAGPTRDSRPMFDASRANKQSVRRQHAPHLPHHPRPVRFVARKMQDRARQHDVHAAAAVGKTIDRADGEVARLEDAARRAPPSSHDAEWPAASSSTPKQSNPRCSK